MAVIHYLDWLGTPFGTFNQIVTSVTVLLSYCVIVRSLRFRRMNTTIAKHGMHSRCDYASMTADQAQEILQGLAEWEFPQIFGGSVVFALFKIYGIPNVSRLLVSTGELSNHETISKRISDTGVLVLEFCLNRPSSQRSMEAVARMNSLHEQYIQRKEISQADMLYTLSLFALEPIRFVEKYEWRPMNDLEQCASGTFWKAMGEEMNLDYSKVVPRFEGSFTDGLDFLDALEKWSLNYEAQRMRPTESNWKVANGQMSALISGLPSPMKTVVYWIVTVLAGERLRKAIMFPSAPPVFRYSMLGLLTLRKWSIRYLALPRTKRRIVVADEPESDGRYRALKYLAEPYYLKPTFKNRWGLRAWINRLLGKRNPGDDGNKYFPGGYYIKEVGPSVDAGQGKEWIEADIHRIRTIGAKGCPFGSKAGK